MIDELFDELLAAVQELRHRAVDDAAGDSRLEAEGLRYVLRFLAAGIAVCVEHDDPAVPELTHSIEDRMSWGLDNADCNYSYARVDGTGEYRISGNRGSARHIEFQINTGHQGDGDFASWSAVSALSGDELQADSDGTFELFIGGDERPANWMALTDEASFLLIRQYFNDWEIEQPAQMAMERLDIALPPVPMTESAFAGRLDLLIQWIRVGGICWADFSAGLRSGEPGDIAPFEVPDEASGLKGQAYGMGGWRCAPDEAIILTFEPPDCRLWSLSLCDRFWQSIDFADRQSSLNGSQATLTETGHFIGVISHHDPGVANWLDPGGETEGTIAVRYLFPDSIPAVSYRRIPLGGRDQYDPGSMLADALPTDTPRITPDERQATLRARRRAIHHRFGR